MVAVPGAFTPTCSEQHLPTFLEQKEAFKKAGVDKIVVVASNDPFVMSAWAKSNGVTDDYIVSCCYCYYIAYTRALADNV